MAPRPVSTGGSNPSIWRLREQPPLTGLNFHRRWRFLAELDERNQEIVGPRRRTTPHRHVRFKSIGSGGLVPGHCSVALTDWKNGNWREHDSLYGVWALRTLLSAQPMLGRQKTGTRGHVGYAPVVGGLGNWSCSD